MCLIRLKHPQLNFRLMVLVLFVHSLMLYYLNFLVLLQFRFFLVDLILQLVVLNQTHPIQMETKKLNKKMN
ncbi:Uncharacterised protein [Streptococcus pneumoniae]|nr:Uncharacterised protein [Streptococcus pneumoniae]